MKKIGLFIAGIAVIVILSVIVSSRDVQNGSPDGVASNMEKDSASSVLISPDELDEMMQNKDFELINVHIPYEGEIDGTDSFIAFNEIKEKIDLPKDKKIVLYCRSGGMSAVATRALVDMGYTNVYDLEGGMIAWENSGRQLAGNDKKAYVALGPSNQVAVIDVANSEILETLPAGNNPHGVAVAGGYVFSSSTKMGKNEMIMEPDHDDGEPMDMAMMMKMGSDEITVTSIEGKKIIKTISVGGGSHHMIATPDGKKVLVVVPSLSGIVVIDVNTLEKADFVETGKVSNYVIVSKDGRKAFVTNKGENTVSVIDMGSMSVVANIKTGIRPDHIAVNGDGSMLFVANGGSDDVSVIDVETGKVVLSIPVGESPHGIALSPDGERLYVANSEDMSVSVMDAGSGKAINTIDIGQEVAHLEVSPDGKRIFVNSESAKAIYVISADSGEVASEINLGKEPHQLVFE